MASIQQSVAAGSLLIAAPVALAAGALSFASPCVLPLVPGYLSFITGLSGAELSSTAHPYRRVLLGGLLFVAGFALVFVSFGAIFGGLGSDFRSHQRTLQIVLGSLTVVLGLTFAGALDWLPLAQRDWRRWNRLPSPGLLGAPILGFLFALGWTPCIGPTLATVLGLAASSDGATAARGALLSSVYCLGLGLPFLVVGLLFSRAVTAMALLRRLTPRIAVAGGVLLALVGVMEVTGLWNTLVEHLQQTVSTTSTPL